eukprot:TRINITY_DN23632_c0_g1_i1.p1 TRINITY_DN23632_c0_g1~~TRINITY_DN23632_c0_g1_i1.p1  ORF type:complete len:220 (-),score=41.10 TRINITY_DN23632_c0_g1_i1:101-760(-)
MTDELDRAVIFNDTTWLLYCLCGGSGIGKLSPLVASDVKELCIHSSCTTATPGGEDGFCYSIENCLCMTRQFAIPPMQGTPPCICCNQWMGAARADGTVSKMEIFEIDKVMKDTFWLYYLFCGGFGFNKLTGPLIQSEGKELCCAGSTGMVSPVQDGIFCSQVATTLCIWQECQAPPAPSNPRCAICCWRLNKEQAHAAGRKPNMPPTTVQMKSVMPSG